MGMKVLTEIWGLIWQHPYVSCGLLVLFTPPFFPILKFFSPLLISTALFIVALVTMGPQFEGPAEQEGEASKTPETKVLEDKGAAKEEDQGRQSKRQKSGKDRSTWSDWMKNYQQSGLAWVEHKLKNENWRGASLNDENVSILQEAFPHRPEEKAQETTKAIPKMSPEKRVSVEPTFEEDLMREIPKLDSWEPSHFEADRGFEMPHPFSMITESRDLPHDMFSPYPSLARRPEPDTHLFENVMPPPIGHDMPPLITGPASDTNPLLKSAEDPLLESGEDPLLESAEDTDSEDGFDHRDCHHLEDFHPDVGERSLDYASVPQGQIPVPVESHDRPAEFQVKDFIPPLEIYEGKYAPPAGIHEEIQVPSATVPEEQTSPFPEIHQETHAPVTAVHEERSLPATEIEHESHAPAIDVHEERSLPAMEIHEERYVPAIAVHEERSLPATEIHQESHAPTIATYEERSLPAAGIHDESYFPPVAVQEKQSVSQEELNNHTSVELHDVPAWEEILPSEHKVHEPAAVAERSFPMSIELNDAEARQDDSTAESVQPNVPVMPADHGIDSQGPLIAPEVPLAPANVHHEHPQSVDRSVSLPFLEARGATERPDVSIKLAHEPPTLPGEAHEPSAAMSHTMSLPAVLSKDLYAHQPVNPIVIPPKSTDDGPLSPDTDIEDDSPEHEKRGSLASRLFSSERNNSITSLSGDEFDSPHAPPVKRLSTFEKLSALEALTNSIPESPSPDAKNRQSEVPKVLKPTTEEQVSHVSDKLKGFIEDGPSKRFQPDAPQLQITPPSIKLTLSPSPSKLSMSPAPNKPLLVSPARRPSIVPPQPVRNMTAGYTSSDESSGDEQVDLDSEVEIDAGPDSDSDDERPLVLRPGMKLRPPPKLPAKLREVQAVEQPA